MSLFKFDDRVVIKISGPDGLTFLQGLLTCNISPLKEEKKIVYGAFLNAKGKFITDVFVLRVSAEAGQDLVLYLDCMKAHIADIFLKLKTFRLRSKVTLELKDQIHVYGCFESDSPINSVGAVDPRSIDLGFRIYTEEELKCDEAGYGSYKKACIQNFIAFGYDALLYEKSFIMEFGFEQWEAVSFSKGCYLGQELTASMHYRKLAKREVVWLKSESFKDQELVGSGVALNDSVVGRVLNQEDAYLLLHLHKNVMDEVSRREKTDSNKEILFFETDLILDKCNDLCINQVYRRISI